MPPVTKAGGDSFRKDVQFAAKDADEQRATGIVMVPDKADLQNDFAREQTIRDFASQFEAFVEAGEAGGGIMHAVFPSEWMALERNEVLDEPEEIGGEEVQAGAWVQEWRFDNDELWSLVDDGVLEGYSIGAIQVQWDGPFEQDADAVDDVEVPPEVGEEMIWELVSGIIREVSAVDIPAVPDAQILETKADAEKRLGDHLGDQQAFIDEAMERGHSEADAERLWDVLNDAMAVEDAGEPGKMSFFERMGKAAFGALRGGDDTDAVASEPTDASSQSGAAKAGQTLSQANRDAAMAAVDANLDMLHDAGMDVPKRFTDREDVDFDLAEHDAREWGGGHGDGGDGEDDEDDSTANNAAGGDTPADGGTNAADSNTDMSDNDPDGGDGDKSLAEQNAAQINELTEAVKSLTEAVDGGDDSPDGDKTAEVELPDGSVAEISKAEAMGWFEGDDNGSAKSTETEEVTKADIEALHARLDQITREQAGSQQLDRNGDGDEDSKLSEIGKALS